MAGFSRGNMTGRQSLFASACGWLLKIFGTIFTLGVLSILLNLFSGMLAPFIPLDWIKALKTPTEWAFQNSVVMILIFIVFLLLMVIFYQGSQRSSPPAALPLQGPFPLVAAGT